MKHVRSKRGSSVARRAAATTLSVGALLAGAALLSGSLASLPARAAGALAPLTTGSSTGAIITGINTGSGQGVYGMAAKNYGVVGKTTSAGLSGTSFFGGVGGVDASTGTARSYSVGVFGQSTNGDGIFGITSFNGWSATGTTAPPTAGVVGIDNSTKIANGFSLESGVYGNSLVGFGAEGISKKGTGSYGQTSATSTTNTFAGVAGYDANTSATSNNVGVAGQSNADVGVYGVTYTGFGVDGVALNPGGIGVRAFSHAGSALRLRADPGGLLASGFNGTKDVMSLDTNGNFIVAGTVTQKGSPLIARATSLGTTVTTRPIEATSATIEDVGEARLVNGRATIALQADFARTIDPRAPYLVFITPEGFSAGALAVISRDRSAFAVGENNGGRSSIAFAYRIVAHPLAESPTRLAPLAVPVTASVTVERPEPNLHLQAIPSRAITAAR